MATIPEPPKEVGAAIPAHTPHAVSVMFPKWQDNIYYEEGDPIVVNKMQCGYPRFFIHPCIKKLTERILASLGKDGEAGMPFPSRKVAIGCREFLKRYHPESQGAVRIVELKYGSEERPMPVYAVIFPRDAFSVAKQYWQHSGLILSSRMAEKCLGALQANSIAPSSPGPKKERHSRYSKAGMRGKSNAEEEEPSDHASYVEERYGRNLPIEFANHAKVALRRRIAGIVSENEEGGEQLDRFSKATASELDTQRSMEGFRGMKGLSEDDVYLYPSGMSSIFCAHQVAMAVGDASRKSVCFGFPYTDTLKILQKFGAGCCFYGLGEDKNIDELEELLKGGERILALFCETPSNPLLKTPDLPRLRKLADEYDFMIVVDETIGNMCNISVLPFADMVVSSLTKLFSGDCNVMGGSMVLNPKAKRYSAIKGYLSAEYEDLLWCEDGLFLERNSRNFKKRSAQINQTAEALCDYLSTHPLVSKVFYPKFTTREHYEAVKNPSGGYGGLFSVIFKSEQVAKQFYDNLDTAKGPSLGTNFTLVSPYTILAHYTELDWAASFGVSPYLVRVSVGLEERERLLKSFEQALSSVTV
ncbi:pyridoxal phosphate-dependent transferase [Dichotomocladium elegans]|nr:pyridoxal phosphate-dependent transferase [Dichotomocladium elegans]